MQSVDKTNRLHTNKPSQEVTRISLHCCLPFLLEFFFDKQRKAIHQGAEISATQSSWLGWFDMVM